MLLLDDDLRARLPPLHAQEAESEPWIYAKFTAPGTRWDWYVMEGEAQGEDFLFFGFITGQQKDFKCFLLSELESVRTAVGSSVERDLHFTEGRLTDVVPAPDS